MEQVLQSLVITHGFFDVYETQYELMILDIFLYLLGIILNILLLYIFPVISIFIFILLSCYHFSQDFKYLKFYNYNIYGSLILITTLADINHIFFWINTIEKIIFINITSTILLFIFSFIFLLNLIKKNNNYYLEKIKKIKKLNIIIFTLLLVFINYIVDSPYKFILYYLALFHSPLAIIRKIDIFGIKILKMWLYLSLVFYIILISFENHIYNLQNSNYYSFILKFIIGILNTHIIFTHFN